METMKNDKQQNAKAPAPGENGVAVYEIRFCRQGGRDIGIENQSPGGSGIVRANERLEITYLPSKRFYRLVEKYLDNKRPTKTIYVPENWATFEPMPE